MTTEPAGARLTKADETALRWALRCNEQGIGYLGPSVRKSGPLPEMAGLLKAGFLTLEHGQPRAKNDRERGYFITDLGRRALAGGRADG